MTDEPPFMTHATGAPVSENLNIQTAGASRTAQRPTPPTAKASLPRSSASPRAARN
jgi:hypothetical protein